MKTSEKNCCCQHEENESQAPVSTTGKGMTFKIEGLDCVEEVTILKSEIGPLVGGENKLAFDVINGRMTVLKTASQVSEKKIIKAITATGMQATRWKSGETQTDVSQRQRSQSLYTVLSGLCIITGILLHIAIAGGFTDIQYFFQNPDVWTYSWQDLGTYLKNLLNAHSPQNMPLAE